MANADRPNPVQLSSHKLVVVGDGAVGKTSLLIRIAHDTFCDVYVPTVLNNETVQVTIGDRVVDVHLWDTAGGKDYNRLRPLSYPETTIAVITFSSVSRCSFENVYSKWLPELLHHLPNTPIVVVATKIDLRSKQDKGSDQSSTNIVTREEGLALLQERNVCHYVETSAVENIGFEDILPSFVNSAGAAHAASVHPPSLWLKPSLALCCIR